VLIKCKREADVQGNREMRECGSVEQKAWLCAIVDMEELKACNCYTVPSLSIAWRGIRG
jgi:hypothetical protein